MCCYCFPQCGHPLAGRATKPKKWPERQTIRVKEYPEDAGGGPFKQFHMRGHLGPSRPAIARLKLHVTGQAPEFQRQIISAAIDLRPQDLKIANVLAPKPAQQLAEEHMLYDIFAGAGFRIMRGIRVGPCR